LAWVVAIGFYYVAQVILRWVKVIQWKLKINSLHNKVFILLGFCYYSVLCLCSNFGL